ncbi:phenylacetate--CoA ligase family protein [Thiothrix lacustris]|uniref:phenylacetate--CoA ligase family protein n=1 Tax=Thiothrix lacustris TaxID=525917 RepID=UPI00048E769C|nr:phenylacetate--CoA ligase family protein [Thiothrix lacustris]
MNIKKAILEKSPVFIQNIAITIYNNYLYRKRHNGKYKTLFNHYSNIENKTKEQINKEIIKIKTDFLDYATSKSAWYGNFKNQPLENFPFLEKSDIVNNLDKIATISEKQGSISLTGGTTGTSMKVIYTNDDIIERQAILDSFRARFGYKLGKKTAWFSGKNIVRDKDIKNGNCYRDDWINNIRFFSTFYISSKNFSIYWNSFTKFSPEYIVGFPSSLYELCNFAKQNGLSYRGHVKVFFPTAENMLDEQKSTIKSVLGCEIVDQYASSEGAPFILQCQKGNLHIHPYTGIFEVLDENNNPSLEGNLVVTSFHTHGTPLIRYQVGDTIKLAPENYQCPCDSHFPVVQSIIGRNNDFIWSQERGRVNLGNISNCTKDVNGIEYFQIKQYKPEEIFVEIVKNNNFTELDQETFVKNIIDRIGNKIKINLATVDEIPKEKSGKYRIVKNFIDFQKT